MDCRLDFPMAVAQPCLAKNAVQIQMSKLQKAKIIKYLCYFLLIVSTIQFFRVILLEIKIHKMTHRFNEEIKANGIDGTNQVSN